MKSVEGNIVDIHNRKIYPGKVLITDEGKIGEIVPVEKKFEHYICPGWVDAHVHIESSMLTPKEFSRILIRKGTLGIVNDPHEIANVAGMEGVNFMIEDAKEAKMKIFFGIPSCVPATPWDKSGGEITSEDVRMMLAEGKYVVLSEMMNVGGVLAGDSEVMRKIQLALEAGIPVDGHAPGLRGEDLAKYVKAGITTDHECTSLEEAVEKIRAGMKILIREGSAAKNFDTLHPLIGMYPDQVMFCLDDAHPEEILEKGGIAGLIRKALKLGYDLFDVLKIASETPVLHYHLPLGRLQKNQTADFLIIENLESFRVLNAYIDGREMYRSDLSDVKRSLRNTSGFPVNRFLHDPVCTRDVSFVSDKTCLRVIGVKDGEIVTSSEFFDKRDTFGNFESDLENDILKLVYINRYGNGKPQIGFIRGFGLKEGAFATTVAHDSHNLLAVGTCDEDLTAVINELIRKKGGLCLKNETGISCLPLPLGGIMSELPAEEVASRYTVLNVYLKEMGCKLHAPFMTLAFMSLLVIPELKIGEKGLFDFSKCDFVGE